MVPSHTTPHQAYGKSQRHRDRDDSLMSNSVLNWVVVAQILFVLGKTGTELDADAAYHLMYIMSIRAKPTGTKLHSPCSWDHPVVLLLLDRVH